MTMLNIRNPMTRLHQSKVHLHQSKVHLQTLPDLVEKVPAPTKIYHNRTISWTRWWTRFMLLLEIFSPCPHNILSRNHYSQIQKCLRKKCMPLKFPLWRISANAARLPTKEQYVPRMSALRQVLLHWKIDNRDVDVARRTSFWWRSVQVPISFSFINIKMLWRLTIK